VLTPSKILFPLTLLTAALGTTLPAQQAKSDEELGIKSASDEGQRQIANFQIPEGFAAKLWAAEPQLANPVAFYVDYRGRVFVAETFRQEVDGVPDNRSHRYWLEDDLRLETVEERQQAARGRRRVAVASGLAVAMITVVVSIFYIDATLLPPVVSDILAMLLGA